MPNLTVAGFVAIGFYVLWQASVVRSLRYDIKTLEWQVRRARRDIGLVMEDREYERSLTNVLERNTLN